MAVKKFRDGDIVVTRFRGKTRIYVYRIVKILDPRLDKGRLHGQKAKKALLTDFSGNIRRTMFREDKLHHAEELFENLL